MKTRQGYIMAEEKNDGLGAAKNPDSHLDRKTTELLSQIKQEPIPDRLLELAMKLQQALNERETKPSS